MNELDAAIRRLEYRLEYHHEDDNTKAALALLIKEAKLMQNLREIVDGTIIVEDDDDHG